MKFSELEGWLSGRPLIGFILLAIVGGIVAHVRMYERSGIELTPMRHFWGIVRRMLSSGFAGLLVFFAWSNLGWSEAWGYFVAGMCGMFSTEFFEIAWSFGHQKLSAMWGSGKIP